MRKLVIDNEELFGRVVELLKEGREVTIPSKGFSMLPFIRGERDLVVLERADDIKPGDIVLFRLDGRYILHRVMDADGALVETMGDGILQTRESCPRKQVYGRAVGILRDGKRRVDPNGRWQRFWVGAWWGLLPIRRWLLAIYRRLPWNGWLREQYKQIAK